MSRKDEAIDWLGKAIDQGFRDDDNEASTEQDLDSLRADPRFVSLLRRIGRVSR